VEPAFDVCQVAGTLPPGVTKGNTSLGTNLEAGSCGGEEGLERVHVFTPSVDGTLQVGLTSEAPLAIYARSDCQLPDSELACERAEQGAAVIYAPVQAGVPVVVVVDGLEPYSGAAYSLTALLSPG
jgi:hypothetical protein